MNSKRKRDVRDFTLTLLILCLISMMMPGIAFGAEAVVVESWYNTVNWTNVIVTMLGGTGLFGAIKYILDYRLGNRKMDVDESTVLRQEMKELLDRMQAEVNGLRRRVHDLEMCLSENDIPIPFHTGGCKLESS